MCAGAAGLWLAFGANASSARACVPGKKEICACRGAVAGSQVCLADGSRLGPCECPTAAPPPEATAAPPEATPAAPAPPPAVAPAPPPAVAPPAVAPAPAAPGGAPTQPAPLAAAPLATQPLPPPAESKTAHGVLVAGIALLSTGYFLSLAGGIASVVLNSNERSLDGGSCFSNPGYLFLPVAGAAISTSGFAQYNFVGNYHNVLCQEASAAVAASGVLVSVLQMGGTGLILGSLIATSGSDSPPPAARHAAMSPLRFVLKPGVAGSPIGLTAGWVWF